MNYWVYALKSITRNYIYVGMTNNLERRVFEHENGKERTTRPYKPFAVILAESYETRKEARAREKQLKSGYGKEYLKSLL